MKVSLRKITSKNQISLTQESMDKMGVEIGDCVIIELGDKGKRVTLVPHLVPESEKK